MKTTLRCLASCCVGLLLLAGCASPAHQTGKWEYKVVEEFNYAGKLEPRLNELAKEGWIVVSASTSIAPGGAVNPMTQVILKRRQHQ
jgi:hypothetical protein